MSDSSYYTIFIEHAVISAQGTEPKPDYNLLSMSSTHYPDGIQRELKDDGVTPVTALANLVFDVSKTGITGGGVNSAKALNWAVRAQDDTSNADCYWAEAYTVRSGSNNLFLYRRVSGVNTLLASGNMSAEGDGTLGNNNWIWLRFAAYTYGGNVELSIWYWSPYDTVEHDTFVGWTQMLYYQDTSEDKILGAGKTRMGCGGPSWTDTSGPMQVRPLT